jgi:integrase
MNDEEIEAFIALPFPRLYKEYKDKKYRNSEFQKKRWEMWSIFWLIQAYTGMRPSEVARLTVKAVEIGEGFFYVLQTKTHEPRKIPISQSIQESIVLFIKSLESDLLFPNRYDTKIPVSISAFEENFKRRKELLGIKRANLTPYSLRHSFASRLITESSIYDVKTLMGHKKITTTERYLHTNEEQLKEVIKNDPLSTDKKTGKELLLDHYETANRLSVKQNEKVYTSIELSEDGMELLIRRRVRAKSPPPVGVDPPVWVSPHNLLSPDDELTS